MQLIWSLNWGETHVWPAGQSALASHRMWSRAFGQVWRDRVVPSLQSFPTSFKPV